MTVQPGLGAPPRVSHINIVGMVQRFISTGHFAIMGKNSGRKVRTLAEISIPVTDIKEAANTHSVYVGGFYMRRLWRKCFVLRAQRVGETCAGTMHD